MPASAPHILTYAGITPAFAAPPTRAGPGAAVLGRVTLGRGVSLGALSVIRADGHFVRIGDDFHLGPRSTVHINHEIHPCTVGDRVAVGADACVHACTVGSDVVIGNGAVILDGAEVGDDVVLEAGTTVFPSRKVASGFVYAGSPAKPVRPLAAGETARLREVLVADQRGSPQPGPAASAFAAGSDLHPSVFVAPTAAVRGRLVAAEGASIWYSNRFDAGASAIRLGASTNIQDNTTIRCRTALGVTIGADATIGHNVAMEDCRIGDRSLIGIGSTVAEGSVIGQGVLLAASARTTPGQVLEDGWLYAGSPARKMAPLDAAKHAMIALIVLQYCQYAKDFAALERGR